jgi:hypothetical protein
LLVENYFNSRSLQTHPADEAIFSDLRVNVNIWSNLDLLDYVKLNFRRIGLSVCKVSAAWITAM